MELETYQKYNEKIAKKVLPKNQEIDKKNNRLSVSLGQIEVLFWEELYKDIKDQKIENDRNNGDEKIAKKTEEIELKGPTGLTGPTGYKERKEIKASFANNQINKILKDFFRKKIFFIPAAFVSLLTFGSYFLLYFRKK